jgi:hypothetical protein
MRISQTAIVALLIALGIPHVLQAQEVSSVSFVTGYSFAQGSPISDVTVSSGVGSNLNIGGRLAVGLAPGFQAVGEVGRIGNVLPPLVNSILGLSSLDLRASAIYGEGGMRAFLGSRSAVNPYVEATGGFAHLNVRVGGISATAEDLFSLGLGLTNRSSPIAGIGGGVMLHSGRATFDVGYRYKKIFAHDFVATLLGGGQSLTSHQVVFGAGVRF